MLNFIWWFEVFCENLLTHYVALEIIGIIVIALVETQNFGSEHLKDFLKEK